jgi:lysozyme
MLNGVDVSSNNAGVQPGKLKGADFVVVKATEGTTYVSPTFKSQVASTLAGGKLLGLYHFARGGDMKAETDAFLAAAKPYIGKAVLFLDWEAPDALVKGVSGAKAWLDYVYSKTGVRPLIYMGLATEGGHKWLPVVTAGYGLWVAQYNNYKSVNGFAPRDIYGTVAHWPTTAMFQYTGCGVGIGYAGKLDFNVFYGDAAAWRKYAKPGKVAAAKATAASGLAQDGLFGPATIRALQKHEGTTVDGVLRRPSNVVKAIQKKLGLTVDGSMGPLTIKAMQKALHTPVDGRISKPSIMVKAMQIALNRGTMPF